MKDVSQSALCALRRHWLFCLVWCTFSLVTLVALLGFSDHSLAKDEFLTFNHARSLLREGRFVPGLSLDSVALRGTPRGTVHVLLTAASLAAFGVNETAARLPALLMGLAAIVALYAMVYRLTGNRTVAFLSVVTLMLHPHVVRWFFASRFYTTILLFHIGTVYCLYRGLEHPYEPGALCEAETSPGVRTTVRRFCVREELHPGWLLLGGLLFWLYLNNQLVMILLPLAVCAYGLFMLLLTMAQRLRKPAAPFRWKYGALAIAFLLGTGGIWMAWSQGATPPLNRVVGASMQARLRDNLDLTFAQRRFRAITPFVWMETHGFLMSFLALIGVRAFSRLWPKARNFGWFAIVQVVFYVAVAFFTWHRVNMRYLIHLHALYAPLQAAGIHRFALVLAVRRDAARLSQRRYGLAVATLALALWLPLVVRPGYVESTHKVPWKHIAYIEAYETLVKEAGPNEVVAMLTWREYYLEQVHEKLGTPPEYTRMDLPRHGKFTREELENLLRKHPSGWVGWEASWAYMIPPDVGQLCRVYMTHKHTRDKTHMLYRWVPSSRRLLLKALENWP